ncbi:MAG TPA: hypothetical protein VLX92_02270 [Kofleriaceae bacterium]|nr:hypothetical protein [Kofleriaceae bacterium]
MNHALAMLSLLVVACGGNAGHPQPTVDASATGRDAGDVAASCTALAQASCNLRQSCSDGGNITHSFGDMATCLQREALACRLAMQAPDTGDTPDAVAACVAAYSTLGCADFFDNNLPAACAPPGGRAAGQACAFASQCQSGYCGHDKTASCGTCADPPAVGAPCRDASCFRGQICDSRTLTCVSDELAGAACDNNTQPCGFALSCDGNSNGSFGVCTAQTGTLGESCSGTPEVNCDTKANLSCTGPAGSRTCEIATYAADGQPCGAQPDGNVSCAAGGECYGAAGTIALAGAPGTCKAAAPDGAACDLEVGPPCLTPARCVVSGGGSQGVCTLPTASCGP